jgi:DNA-binding ferritin-like protein (Dps family)
MTTEKLPISIYTAPSWEITVDVTYDNNSLWLNEQQMAQLFGIDRSVIWKHIRKVYKELDLDKKSNVQKMPIPNSDKPISMHNLDIIIWVGYKVNTKQWNEFRKRATSILKEYTLQWYAINKNRLWQTWLKALEETMSFLKQTLKELPLWEEDAKAISDIIIQYTTTWASLYQYDTGEMDIIGWTQTPENVIITWEFLHNELVLLKEKLMSDGTATDLFGTEKYSWTLTWIVWNVYQTYDGAALYSTVESKAAHLLYFVIKDHPFNDGNKRSWAFLFILFLKLYGVLYDWQWQVKINDRWLTALTLLIAQSDPKHKDLLIQLVIYLIQ